MYCSNCGSSLSNSARFCSRCGTGQEPVSDETFLGDAPEPSVDGETLAPGSSVPAREIPRTPTPRLSERRPSGPSNPPRSGPRTPSASSPLTSSDPIGGGRFTPGAIVAERYRIVALLGRGGMGEVYRAEDLRLSQVLAIKFLPEALSSDAAALARFHSEVRVARQVSHPNVCRVFDIGDADGIPFLTMEYVDGEDLSSLVRRIGRLPQDKAIEVSRQICAGLSAAHERGVIHRDLKPSNIMLDGAGKVRVTDFGLAAIAANIQGTEIRAGTPAYMAPEQLAGKEVTAKSDIYSLGLVMYEVLTGKRAYEASTLPELMRAREEGAITNPSSLVKDLDPLLERVILRCLDRDPGKRPASVLQVAAALPGGDPLAAALAAGETPSPAMVAAAGQTEGLNPKIGALCFLGVLVMLALLLFVNKGSKLVSYFPFGDSPEVLAKQARSLSAKFGYADAPVDAAWGFRLQRNYFHTIEQKDKSTSRWAVLRGPDPPAMVFWYRQSPIVLASYSPVDNLIFGRIKEDEPQFDMSGSRLIGLSLDGRLLYFKAVPPQVDEPAKSPFDAPNWAELFAAAGLEMKNFHPTEPRWYPLAWGDSRAAWEGVWPSRSDVTLRIEAAGYRGRPIYFQLLSPWDTPTRMVQADAPAGNKFEQGFSLFLGFSLFTFGIWLSLRHVRTGRSDLRGASRLALMVFFIGIANWLLLAHHVAEASEFIVFLLAIAAAMLFAGFTWVLYTALEPYVRRYWPDSIISWSRLLGGRFTDPLVARDVLLGALFGLTSAVLEHLQPTIEMALGRAPMQPMGLSSLYSLEGLRGCLASIFYQASQALPSALIIFFLFLPLRLLLKKNWLAALVMALLFCIPSLGTQNPLIDALFTGPFFLAYLFVLSRFGLVTLVTLYFVDQLADSLPLAMPLTAWYTQGGLLAIIVIVVLAFFGFHISRAGKPVFGTEDLEAS